MQKKKNKIWEKKEEEKKEDTPNKWKERDRDKRYVIKVIIKDKMK